MAKLNIKKLCATIILANIIGFSMYANAHTYASRQYHSKTTAASIQKKKSTKLQKKSLSKAKTKTKKQLTKKPTAKLVRKKNIIIQEKKSSTISNQLPNPALTSYAQISLEQRIVNLVRKTVDNLQYTTYKLGGSRMDTHRGIYIVDCSRYVDHIIKKAHPKAYSTLARWSGTPIPTSKSYYNYFNRIAQQPHKLWSAIKEVSKLRPGDILAFQPKAGSSHKLGHVLIVMDKPIRHKDSFILRVTDSAIARHSKDTRQIRKSGVGIGTMLLKVDPKTLQPYAYAWQIGSRWNKNMKFAMGRALDVG